MITQLQRFIQQTIHMQHEVSERYFELYDEAQHVIGEYEIDETGTLRRVQFFIDEQACDMMAAEEATSRAQQIVSAFEKRPLQLDALISYEAHYLVIFEEVDERYKLPLPNTGAHISLTGDGQLLEASFFHEPYTVQYAENIISQQQADDKLHALPFMQLAIDTEKWCYTYVRDHDILGLHVNGDMYRIQDDGGLTIAYTPMTTEQTNETLEQAMLNSIGQNIVVQQDKSFEGVQHYYVAQRNEDAAYTLDLSAFDNVDKDVHELEVESQYELVELQDDGIHLPETVLRARAEQIVHALVGNEAAHYELEETHGLEEMLAASPFYAQMEPPSEKMYRFLYKAGDVYIHDKPIEISMHCSTGLAVEVVKYDIPYDKLNVLREPTISLERANDLAAAASAMKLSFMRTSIEDNVYDLAYLITYPNSPTGGAMERIDAYDGTLFYVYEDADAQ